MLYAETGTSAYVFVSISWAVLIVEMVDVFEVVAVIEVFEVVGVVKILGIDEDKFLNIASKT